MSIVLSVLRYLLQAITIPTSIYGFLTFCGKTLSWWKRKRSKSIVLLDKQEWAIIAPRYKDNFQRKEDVLAAIKIRDWCLSLGIKCAIYDDHDPIPQGKDLFFICGPKANQRVAHFYKGFNLQLGKSGDDYVISDKLREMDIPSKMKAKGAAKADCAILSRRIDPNSGRSYIFCMGIHGHGTLGAAHMLTTGLASGIAKNAPHARNFESIVLVPYVDDYCSIANLEFVMPPRES